MVQRRQLALPAQGDGLPGKSARLAGSEVPGGVAEDELAVTGEAKELAQYGQPLLAAAGHGPEECLDIVHVGQRPVGLAPLAEEEDGEIAGGRQAGLDGVVGPGPGAGAASAQPRRAAAVRGRRQCAAAAALRPAARHDQWAAPGRAR
jgi:hypothetical protein